MSAENAEAHQIDGFAELRALVVIVIAAIAAKNTPLSNARRKRNRRGSTVSLITDLVLSLLGRPLPMLMLPLTGDPSFFSGCEESADSRLKRRPEALHGRKPQHGR